MVNNLVFRWPKPLFFMVLGAHGINGVVTPISRVSYNSSETPFF